MKYPRELIVEKNTVNLKGIKGDEVTYKPVGALAGRGQVGIANFYKAIGETLTEGGDIQWLIKEDRTGTCVLEGSAYFVEDAEVLPKAHINSVNYARAGYLKTENGEKTISVQKKVTSDVDDLIMPLDSVVFGKKRNPKTLLSEEWWHSDRILKSINQLSSDAQWDLATAIFASQLAGDESLHVGQFMALTNSNKNISRIVRIDLGARERFAEQRERDDDYSPFNNSNLYIKSGQFGKNYLDFLLTSSSLKFKVATLWSTANTNGIRESSRNALLDQFSILSEKQKEAAYKQILDIINKKAITPFSPIGSNIEDKINHLIEHISDIDLSRALKMREKAKHYLSSSFPNRMASIKNCQPTVQRILTEALDLNKNIILNGRECSFYEILDFHHKLSEVLKNHKNFKSEDAKVASEIMLDTFESYKLSIMNKPDYDDIKKTVDELIERYKIIHESSMYCIKTSSEEKRQIVSNVIIKQLLKREFSIDEFKMSVAQNIGMHNVLKSVRSVLHFSGKSDSHLLLESIFNRLNLPVEKLNFSEQQLNLMNAIHKFDSDAISQIVSNSSFSVYDALVPDVYGRTALHYIMKNASNAKDYDSIAKILYSSLGVTVNTSVDIEDCNRDTPLDFLAQNPNKEKLIESIGQSKLLSSRNYFSSARYELNYFFKKRNIDEIIKQPVIQDNTVITDPKMEHFLSARQTTKAKPPIDDGDWVKLEAEEDWIELQPQKNALNISSAEWMSANDFFEKNKTAVKCDKKSDSILKHYFIKVNNEIFGVTENDVLGYGGFGKVKLCQTQNGDLFAVKIEGFDDEIDDDKRKQAQSEYDLAKKAGLTVGKVEKDYSQRKPFLPSKKSKDIQDPESYLISKKQFTVQKLMPNGSLKDKLGEIDQNSSTMKEKLEMKISLMKKTVDSVSEIHALRIIHADLNENNLMFDSSDRLLPIDYGLAKELPENSDRIKGTGQGTPGYRAPEVLREAQYSFASDIYAIGHIFERSLLPIDGERAFKLVQQYGDEHRLNEKIKEQTSFDYNFSSILCRYFKNNSEQLDMSEFEFKRLLADIGADIISELNKNNSLSPEGFDDLVKTSAFRCYQTYLEKNKNIVDEFKNTAILFEPLVKQMKQENPDSRPSMFFIESMIRRIQSKEITSHNEIIGYINKYDKKYDNTLLGAWLLEDDELLKKLALDESKFKVANPLLQDDKGKTVLHHLIEQGKMNEVIKIIIAFQEKSKQYSEPNICSVHDNKGDTPLHLIAKRGDLNLLSSLTTTSGQDKSYDNLRSSQNISDILYKSMSERDASGRTPIQVAALDSDKDKRVLINLFANIMRLSKDETSKYHSQVIARRKAPDI